MLLVAREMDESGCSAFEAYQQKQKDDEEDIEDLSEDCNVIVSHVAE